MSTEFPPRKLSADTNPYAPPDAVLDLEPIELIPIGDLAAAEAVRQAHIGHESSVKSIGMLHYLGAFFVLLGSGVLLFNALSDQVPGPPMTRGLMIGLGVVYLAMSGLHLALGIGLTRLQSWARWTDVVLIALALSFYGIMAITLIVMRGGPSQLIGILLGSAILLYILYLLLSARSTTIFSPEYKTIIAQTPHIKYRTSVILKIFVVLLVVVFVLAVIGALVARPR
jgi:hypothetical protein